MRWPRIGSRTRWRIKVSSDVALLAPEALRESADVLPPLQSAVGGLIYLLDLSRTMSSNIDETRRIADRVDQISALLEYAVPDATNISAPVKIAIDVFDHSLRHINEQLSDIRRKLAESFQLDKATAAFTMAVSVSLEQRLIQTEKKLNAVHIDMDTRFNALEFTVNDSVSTIQKGIVSFICPSEAII
ncbi:hypothetical protein FA95DRAFT_1601459 [Auriscalpium vulgare]|uniref:Uncharacterized protein n=1 Tax=Auriscalpium vulgare TaxID=40419 RepID=A0ACB8S8X4_9AGAM|nr:hypothetical protein FA95DRAFT_1601459 [Auriscalpium vulgare]